MDCDGLWFIIVKNPDDALADAVQFNGIRSKINDLRRMAPRVSRANVFDWQRLLSSKGHS